MNIRPPKPALLASALTAAALLATAAPLATAATATPSRAGTAPTCQTSSTLVWLANAGGNGTAGSILYRLSFTNLSARTCSLRGFPVVSAVNLAGAKLGTPAAREAGKRPKAVAIPAGETVHATLRAVDPGVFSTSECHPVTAAGVDVTLPGQKTGRVIPFPLETCARRPGESALTVGPIG